MTPQTIRNCRRSLNLTQKQFALHMGVSRRTVIRWETGDNLPWGAKHGQKQKVKRHRFFKMWDLLEAREAVNDESGEAQDAAARQG